jgi:hypothetical protein
MTLRPRDGLVKDPATTWCLSDELNQTVLIYSLEGAAITFIHSLERSYTAEWLTPNTGEAESLPNPINPKEGTVITKPTSDDWLLLLHSLR